MSQLKVFEAGSDDPHEDGEALKASELEAAIAHLQARCPDAHRIEVWFNGTKLYEVTPRP